MRLVRRLVESCEYKRVTRIVSRLYRVARERGLDP